MEKPEGTPSPRPSGLRTVPRRPWWVLSDPSLGPKLSSAPGHREGTGELTLVPAWCYSGCDRHQSPTALWASAPR